MAARAWTPADATSATLVGWFDASDAATFTLDASDRVQEWRSKVGGWKVTQANQASQPTRSAEGYGGRPAVLFTQASHHLSAPAPAALPTGSDAGVMSGVATYLVRRGDYTTLFYYGSANGRSARSISAAGEAVSAGYYGNDVTGNVRWTGFCRMFVSAMSSTGLARHWVNGGAAQVEQKSTLTTPVNSTFWLGRSINGDPWQNPAQEVELWKGELSADDRQRLDGYHAWKWGLVADMPADHPYKNAAPTIDDGAAPEISGRAAITFGTLSVASSAAVGLVAAAAIALGSIGITSEARSPVAGSAAVVLDRVGVSGAGAAPVTAIGAAALGPVTVQAAGSMPIAASASVDLGAIAIEAAGAVPAGATAQILLGPIDAAASGRLPVGGTMIIALAGIGVSATATTAAIVTREASASITLAAIGVSGSASAASRGAASVTLSAIGATGQGRLQVQGQAVITLGPVQAVGVGRSAPSIEAKPSYVVRMPAVQRIIRMPRVQRVIILRKGSPMLTWPRLRPGAVMNLAGDWSDQLAAGDTIVSRDFKPIGGVVSAEERGLVGGVHTLKVTAIRPGVGSVVMTAVTAAGETLIETVHITVD